MALYTSSYLKGLSRNKSMNETQRLFSVRNQASTVGFDIFIAHSFLDKDEVEGLYIELTNMGYSVYVDWIVDPQLDRNNVTKETAVLIRKRLKSSKSLLLAISTNAAISKWIPWELGFVDGNTSNCAIVPVSKENVPISTFDRREFLSLYPYVEKRSLQGAPSRLWAIESSREYTQFSNWVNGSKPIYQSMSII